jgi:hypothetical protein
MEGNQQTAKDSNRQVSTNDVPRNQVPSFRRMGVLRIAQGRIKHHFRPHYSSERLLDR